MTFSMTFWLKPFPYVFGCSYKYYIFSHIKLFTLHILIWLQTKTHLHQCLPGLKEWIPLRKASLLVSLSLLNSSPVLYLLTQRRLVLKTYSLWKEKLTYQRECRWKNWWAVTPNHFHYAFTFWKVSAVTHLSLPYPQQMNTTSILLSTRL